MNRLVVVTILVTGVFLAGPGRADQVKESELCERLLIQLENALQKRVQGDLDNRVRVALAAHERLGCDPQGLLDVLRVRRPKKAERSTQ